MISDKLPGITELGERASKAGLRGLDLTDS